MWWRISSVPGKITGIYDGGISKKKKKSHYIETGISSRHSPLLSWNKQSKEVPIRFGFPKGLCQLLLLVIWMVYKPETEQLRYKTM